MTAQSSLEQDRLLVVRTSLDTLKWRHHGLGMLQGEVDETTRVHIWSPELRTIPDEGYRDVHDHRFDLLSTILIGAITDVRYHVSAAFFGEGVTDAWEIKHAKIQTVVDRPRPDHGPLPDPSVPEVDAFHIGRANIVELSRAVFKRYERYEVPKRIWHTTRVSDFALTLVRRSNFDNRPARILGQGHSAIIRYADDDPARKTHADLVASMVDRAVREVRGLR